VLCCCHAQCTIAAGADGPGIAVVVYHVLVYDVSTGCVRMLGTEHRPTASTERTAHHITSNGLHSTQLGCCSRRILITAPQFSQQPQCWTEARLTVILMVRREGQPGLNLKKSKGTATDGLTANRPVRG